MASADGGTAAQLASRVVTHIAKLGPEMPNQALSVVRGEITITWPYNSVTKVLAFLLAEPDVRLRRAKGQIRVELHGPSAKVASECGLGAGDELLLSLDGVKWGIDESPGRIPGARSDWQMQFGEKLFVQVKLGESGEIKHINIDHPAPEQADGPVSEPPRAITPEPVPQVSEVQSAVRKISDIPPNEYPSPAFVKRARLSYGALFEGGFDILEEDGGIRGHGRKRTRFGRDSSAWRYTSQSPSPEPSSPVVDAMKEDLPEIVTHQPSRVVQMTDEAPKTAATEVVETNAAAVVEPNPIIRAAAWSPLPVSSAKEGPMSIPNTETTATTSTPRDEVQEEHHPAVETTQPPVTETTLAPGLEEHLIEEPAPEATVPEETMAEAPRSSPPPPEEVPSVSISESKPVDSSFSMFGTAAPARVESSLSLADQVRFGFSHIPQTAARSPSPPGHPRGFEQVYNGQDPYPASYLDETPGPAKFADMETTLSAAEEPIEAIAEAPTAPPEPPVLEQFPRGRWEMSAQSPHYNPIEGGHFGTDALEEGSAVIAGQTSLHADAMVPEQVPEGFASYGGKDLPDEQPEESSPVREIPHDEQPFVENEDTISDDEVGVEDEEDADAEYDEYAYGEKIEEGDYDQRNYDIPEDDDDGLSDEDEEVELETEERYGNGEMYEEDEEDEEGVDFDEDEEDYGSDEEDEEDEDDYMEGYQARRPAPPSAPTGAPVVISLLSDSEDDDEDEPAPAPAPSKPAPSKPPVAALPVSEQRVPEPEVRSEQPPSLPSQAPPAVLDTVEKDDSMKKTVPDDIYSKTQVVDFAARLHQGPTQQSVLPTAEAPSDANTSFAGQAESSVDAFSEPSSLSQPNLAPEPESAPSETSSQGLFVSQPQPRAGSPGKTQESSSSETSSSEGLFLTQPRARSPGADAGEKPVDGGSSNGDVNVDEASGEEDEEMSEEQAEQGEPQSEAFGVDGTDERHLASQEPAEQDEVDILSDGDEASFASQVDVDEEVAEDEDDDMSVDEAPAKEESEGVIVDEATSKISVSVSVESSPMEVEEVTASEDDVDMIDAGSAEVESASPEARASQGPPPESASEATAAVSDIMITEVVSEEVAVVEAVDESLPESGTSATPGTQDVSQQMDEQVPDNVEVLQNMLGNLPTPPETHPAEKASTTQQHSLEFAADLVLEDAIITEEVHEHAETTIVQEPIEDAPAPAAEAPREVGHIPSQDDDNDHAIAGGQESEVLPNSTTSDQQPTVVELSEAVVKEQPVVLPSSPPTLEEMEEDNEGKEGEEEEVVGEEDGEEEEEVEELAADAAVDSDQQTDEVSLLEPPPLAAAEVDEDEDETMILEQLTQETQQALQTEATEAPARTPTPPPATDISVQLARQAVAAKRQKETPEPVRTSPRVTRARSSSLQSHATPERDEDTSVSLAKAALSSPSKHGAEASGSKRQKKAAEPVRTSPRVTRARSSSLQSHATPERDEDTSVSLAKAALASPSKHGTEVSGGSTSKAPPTSTTTTTSTTTALATLKADLTRLLRTNLPEALPLKSLRTHVEKLAPAVLAVVTSTPSSPPARAKGGPREYLLTLRVTDPSVPVSGLVVEAQVYRPHKESLPVVRRGDVVLLRGFVVKALRGKGFGLRSAGESGWAVWDGKGDSSDGDGGVRGKGKGKEKEVGEGDGSGKVEEEGETEMEAPQIRGPPVEDWQGYVPYVKKLREWFTLTMADEAARGRLERAEKKMDEAGGAASARLRF